MRAPALIVVVPEKVFTPVRVRVPAPNLVKPPEPLITPDNVSSPASPVDKVFPVAMLIDPSPKSDFIVSFALTCKEPGAETRTSVPSDKEPVIVKVP